MADVKSQLQLAIAAARAGKKAEAEILAKKVLDQEPDNVNALLLMGALSESQAEQLSYMNQVLAVDPEHEGARERLRQLEISPETEQAVQDEMVDEELIGLSFEELPETIIGEASQAPAEDIGDFMSDELDETWLKELDDEPVTEIGQLLQEKRPPATVQRDMAETRLSFDEQEQGETIPAWLLDEGGYEERTVLMREEPAVAAQPVSEQEIPDWLFAEPEEEWLEPASGKIDAGEELVFASAQPAPVPGPEDEAKPRPRVSNRGLELLLILLIILALIIVAGLVYLILNPL